MPTAKIPEESGVDLNGISSLAQLFLGKTTNQSTSGTSTSQNAGAISTTGTRTVSDNVSQAAIDATVKSILEGTQGLAAVSSGQNRAGMYNSSTNRMLVNDLIARSAAEGAKLNKTQTTSTNEVAGDTRSTTTSKNDTVTQKVAPQINPAKAVTGLGIASTIANTPLGKEMIGKVMGKPAAKAGTAASAAGSTRAAGSPSVVGPANSFDEQFTQSPTIGGNQFAAPISRIDGSGQNPTPGAAMVQGFGTDISSDLGTNLDFNAGTGNEFDFSNLDSGSQDFFGNVNMDAGANSADAGSAAFDAFAGGGDFVDASVGSDLSGVDFGSGLDGQDFFNGDFFDFAEGGHVTPQGNANMLKKQQGVLRKGYATGGLVDLTNTGVRSNRKAPTPESSPSTTGASQVVGAKIPRNIQESARPELAPTSGKQITRPARIPFNSQGSNADAGTSGEGVGTTDGPTDASASAVAGAVGMGLGMTMGPVAGLASAAVANAMGLSPMSMNPVSQVVNAIVNSMTVGATTVDGALDGIADNAAVTLGLSQAPAPLGMQDNAFDSFSFDDAPTADGNGGDAPGEGSGAGPGASAGDAGGGDGGNGSAGDGSGSDGGSASAATGKYIQGPGSETSDSIPINVSAGEFVLNADAVKAVGLDTLNWINDTFKPSQSKLAAGKKVQIAQRKDQ